MLAAIIIIILAEAVFLLVLSLFFVSALAVLSITDSWKENLDVIQNLPLREK